MNFATFSLIRLYLDVKRSNQLRTQFVTPLHKTGGDMSFVTSLLIQL